MSDPANPAQKAQKPARQPQASNRTARDAKPITTTRPSLKPKPKD